LRIDQVIGFAGAWLVLLGGAACAEPGVILHQTHRFSARAGVDTLRTYITGSQVRIEHEQGDAILDLQHNRLVLLDRAARTWRQMPLQEWEQAIRDAAEIESRKNAATAQRAPAFQRFGAPLERAGYLCDRWSLYTRRELLPGEVDWVEQHLWVARDLTLPPGAYEAYDRAIRALDSIGMGALVQRPEGVVLASEIRVGTQEEHEKGQVEVESLTVYRVEKVDLQEDVFAIPEGFTPAPPEGSDDAPSGSREGSPHSPVHDG